MELPFGIVAIAMGIFAIAFRNYLVEELVAFRTSDEVQKARYTQIGRYFVPAWGAICLTAGVCVICDLIFKK